MNALDLAKVAKSFGFSVPPRVNVTIGGGSGGTGRGGKRRRRDEEDAGDELKMEEIEVNENDLGMDEDDDTGIVGADRRSQVRRIGKDRRVETLGKRKVDKEVFRNGHERKRLKNSGSQQWSR